MTSRTLKDIKIADVQKRKVPSKHYVYVIRVTWSDGSVNVVYRRYSKFFDLQTKLLEEFPDEGGVKDPSKRVLPFLPGKIVFKRSHVREVAVKRKEPIQEYCTTLIALPRKISQSELVIKFFEPQPEDIELPSETKKKNKETADSISDPVSLEQYVAIADYHQQNRNEITMVAGDVVEVIDKNENGWWFVNLDEEQGWIPAAYLESVDGRSEDMSGQENPAIEVAQYITTTAFKADLDDELSFEAGVIVTVLQKNFDGWWLIRYQNKEGWAPAMYLKIPDPSHLHAAEVSRVSGMREVGGVAPLPAVAPPAKGNYVNKDKRVPPRKASVKRSFKKPLSVTNVNYGKGIEAIKQSSTFQSPEAEYFTVGDFQALAIKCGLNFDKGESVEVLDKNPNGWWYGKIEGKEGWIPSSYLGKREKSKTLVDCAKSEPAHPEGLTTSGGSKPLPSRPPLPQSSKPKPARPQLPSKPARPQPKKINPIPDKRDISGAAKVTDFRESHKQNLPTNFQSNSQTTATNVELYSATADFVDSTDGVLQLNQGDVVVVAEKPGDEWWLATLNGREGWVPASYLREKRERPVKRPQRPKPAPPKIPAYPSVNRNIGNPLPTSKPCKQTKPVPSPRTVPKNASNVRERVVGEVEGSVFDSKLPMAPPRNESKGYVPKESITSDQVRSYCIATASYSYEGFSFEEGCVFEFIEDSHSGWWLVKTESGHENWAPASHLAIYPKTEQPMGTQPRNHGKQVYIAIATYKGDGENAISFKEGDEMKVLEKHDSGWWLVQDGSNSGWAPSNYLRPGFDVA